jgi:hypothetical protein
MLLRMSEMETKLDSVIQSIQGTVGVVVDLIGQVMTKLEDAGTEVDLSDETSTLEGLQTDLQSAVDKMQGALGTTPSTPADTSTPPTERPFDQGSSTGTDQPV